MHLDGKASVQNRSARQTVAKHPPEKRRRRQIFRQDDSGGKASASKAQDHSGVASARYDHKRRHTMAKMQQEGTGRGGRRPRSDHQPQRPSNAKAPERRVVPTGQTGASYPQRWRRQSQPKSNDAAHQGAPAAVPVTGAEAPQQGQAQEATPDRRPATTDTSLWRGVATVAPPRWRTRTGHRRNRGTPEQIQPGGDRIRRRDTQICPHVTTAGDHKRRQRPRFAGWEEEKREGGIKTSRAGFGRAAGWRRRGDAACGREAGAGRNNRSCVAWEGEAGGGSRLPLVASLE